MSLTIDKDQILRLRRDGAKIERPDGKGLIEPEKVPVKTELDLLSEIADKLDRLIEKEDKEPSQQQPPRITVKPPEVTVNLPETKRHRKWKFVLTRMGNRTEIEATGVE